MKTNPFLLLVFCCVISSPVVLRAQEIDSGEAVEDNDGSAEAGYVGDIKKRYREMLKDPGQVSKQTYEWIKEDIENIHKYEYRVLTIEAGKQAEMEKRLNELGEERWNLVSAFPRGLKLVFIFKRSKRSYLKALRADGILKMLQGDQGAE